MDAKTISEIAVQAAADHEKELKIDRLRNSMHTQELTKKWFRVQDINLGLHSVFNGKDNASIVVDGITFMCTGTWGGSPKYVQILGICPACNNVSWSIRVSKMWQVGCLLEKFVPRVEHQEECAGCERLNKNLKE